jgi:hypothetical protein
MSLVSEALGLGPHELDALFDADRLKLQPRGKLMCYPPADPGAEGVQSGIEAHTDKSVLTYVRTTSILRLPTDANCGCTYRSCFKLPTSPDSRSRASREIGSLSLQSRGRSLLTWETVRYDIVATYSWLTLSSSLGESNSGDCDFHSSPRTLAPQKGPLLGCVLRQSCDARPDRRPEV